jgi:phosphoenolpyruvate carboxykinase (ATP)
MLHAALAGGLGDVEYRTDDIFGFEVPKKAPGVDATLLDPRSTWADPSAYDRKARELAAMFADNFDRRFPDVDETIIAAGPAA